jgi:SOS response regulatory protein OraA/RecX
MVIYRSILKKQSKEELIKKGLNSKIIDKVLSRVKETGYKREESPKCI